ncbi:ABC transporter substrate-binding protein [Sphaerisporangium sp. NPDC051017]|uniref:ABC transporter substrate-binding protein n=1 Tax=Sphaerisporangium sp. NPDC051017 TaxID=3154636 RepID=UPI003434C1D4
MTGRGRHLRVGVCLSLSGRYGRFGGQARAGLEVWRAWAGAVELVVEDDESRPDVLESGLLRLAEQCDILLGPYSTQLMRRAGDVAARLDRLIWNHGGAGDDVEAAHPGHVVSVPTPASRYAEPFLHHLASEAGGVPLWIAHGKGAFGRQVAAGAEVTARSLSIPAVRVATGRLSPPAGTRRWALMCAGSFEEDVETVRNALALANPPSRLCAVAAGVREFGQVVGDPRGIYGVGQWSPGSGGKPELGPAEADFVAAYTERAGVPPDYPAVQAAATAAIAVHCARATGSTSRDALWSAATRLQTTTMFGDFRIDPLTGTQTAHRTVLVRWDADGPSPVR